jgi:hypothetical protein
MEYQHFTIKEAMRKIVGHELYLPAIQRKFVWGPDQIERLFDSIMRDYPIGTFLFWLVQKEKRDDYVFYEFIDDYHERDRWKNKLARKPHLPDNLIGVLDGQQRLNSMYVALQGKYHYKKPYGRWDNDNAFPPRRFYINALKPEVEREDDDFIYEFRFLTDDEAKQTTDQKAWCPVKDLLSFEKVSDVRKYWRSKTDELFKGTALTDAQGDLALEILERLYERLTRTPLINYFPVVNQELDEVLDIFVRVNSAGKVLSKSDLLFSTIVAHWENGREEIEKFLDEINRIGQGFYFNTDYMMRACLVLSDSAIRLQVASFKEANVKNIIANWLAITKAVREMVHLLNRWGFSGETLSATNATIPIAYCILKGVDCAKSSDDLHLYLVKSLVLGIYGASSDGVLTEVRKCIQKQVSDGTAFSMSTLEADASLSGRSFRIDEEVFDELLETGKGPRSFTLLSLLYKHFKFDEIQFHQDHIHPNSRFNWPNLRALGLTDDEIRDWFSICNNLPNLQLLKGQTNQSKNAQALESWVMASMPTDVERESFFRENMYPGDIGLELKDFRKFYDARKKLLVDKLRPILSVKAPDPARAPSPSLAIDS